MGKRITVSALACAACLLAATRCPANVAATVVTNTGDTTITNGGVYYPGDELALVGAVHVSVDWSPGCTTTGVAETDAEEHSTLANWQNNRCGLNRTEWLSQTSSADGADWESAAGCGRDATMADAGDDPVTGQTYGFGLFLHGYAYIRCEHNDALANPANVFRGTTFTVKGVGSNPGQPGGPGGPQA